jgi:hypothetical protein
MMLKSLINKFSPLVKLSLTTNSVFDYLYIYKEFFFITELSLYIVLLDQIYQTFTKIFYYFFFN